MKKILLYCTLLELTFVSPLFAQTVKNAPRQTAQERYEQRLKEVQEYNAYVERYMGRDISHRLGGWGQIGYSSIQANKFATFNASTTGNVGGGIGIGYQLRYKTLLVETGLEFQAYQSKWSLYSDDKKNPMLRQSYPVQISSPNGLVDATAVYSYANTTEKLVAGYLQIPVLAGMELIDHQMYFLVGPKLGLNILSQSQLQANASLHIEDPELVAPLSNLPTHQLDEQAMTHQSSALKLGMNLALMAEIGMSLDKYYQPKESRKTRLSEQQQRLKALHTRIAVFGEYGAININTSQPRQDWTIPFSGPKVGDEIDLNQVQMCSSLQTASATSAKVNPWMIGVKMSVWYDLPRKQLRTKALPKAPQQNRPQPQPTIEPAPQPEPEAFTYEEKEITLGMNIKIENLFFATNKTEVLPESTPALEQLYEFLRDNPTVHILLIGHTDSIGSIKDNLILSEGRVNSVRYEMVKRGINASRIQTEGRGESEPVDTNSTEQGRQNNRRVEFVIIKIENE